MESEYRFEKFGITAFNRKDPIRGESVEVSDTVTPPLFIKGSE